MVYDLLQLLKLDVGWEVLWERETKTEADRGATTSCSPQSRTCSFSSTDALGLAAGVSIDRENIVVAAACGAGAVALAPPENAGRGRWSGASANPFVRGARCVARKVQYGGSARVSRPHRQGDHQAFFQ
jgi:hypothetical protein